MKPFLSKLPIFFALTLSLLILVTPTFAQNSDTSGHIDWGDWSFDYRVGEQNDGLAIQNVTFRNNEIMGQGSFPVMPVYYQDNRCGPYFDRLDTDLEPVSWANNALLVAREFTINGQQWYELGIRQFIGSYDIYQVWYFSDQGIIDAHLFSRGLQCQVFHEHYPFWRFDFDISGNGNDQIQRLTNNGYETLTTEFDLAATSATNHGWRVQDSVTGDYADLTFDSGQWNVTGTIIPETDYANNRVGGVLYNSDEKSWDGSRQNRIPFVESQNIDSKDISLWYTAYLPHSVSEGENLWHSTGVRINIGSSETTPTPQPTTDPQPTTEPQPTATTATNSCGSIDEFVLIDGSTNAEVQTITDGGTIVKTFNNYSVIAKTSGSIASINFNYNTPSANSSKTENVIPYAMFGDSNGVTFGTSTFSTGNYSITARGYSERSLGGELCDTKTINFTVSDSSAQPTSTPTPQPTATIVPNSGNGCSIYTATDTPKSIPDSGSVTSSINVPNVGAIQDVNVVNLDGLHTYMNDLDFRLSSPNGTEVNIINRVCLSNDNFNLSLDDEANATISCPPTSGQSHKPSDSLSAFDNQSADGMWQLRISDLASRDTGTINGWGLEICIGTSNPQPTPTSQPTATAQPTATQVAQSTATAIPVENPQSLIFVSLLTSGQFGSVFANDEDIIAYNNSNNSWSMFIDGSDIGLGSSWATDIDAFHIMADSSVIMSLTGDASLPNIGAVSDEDLVRFVPSSIGDNTSGSFEFYFDGSDIGLTNSSEDIDAVFIDESTGDIYFSVKGSLSALNTSGKDEDIFRFQSTSLGASTQGSLSLHFDGSDESLSNLSTEDVYGYYDDGTKLYFTTRGSHSVDGGSGDGTDILSCNPSSLGSSTTCSLSNFWDGVDNGISSDLSLDGIHIGTAPRSFVSVQAAPVAQENLQLVYEEDFEGAFNWDVNVDTLDSNSSAPWQPINLAEVASAPIDSHIISSQTNAPVAESNALIASGGDSILSEGNNGSVTIASPMITLPSDVDLIALVFSHYVALQGNNDTDDFFRVWLELEDGDRVIVFEELVADAVNGERNENINWQVSTSELTNWAGESGRLIFESADIGKASQIEVGIDNIQIRSTFSPTAVSFSDSSLNRNLTLLLIPILIVGFSTAYIFIRRRKNAL